MMILLFPLIVSVLFIPCREDGHWCLQWSEDTKPTCDHSIHTQLQRKGKERLLLSARLSPQRIWTPRRADPGSSAPLLLSAWSILLEPVQRSALLTWCVVCTLNAKADDVPSISLRGDWVGPVPRALGLPRSSGTCCSLYASENSGT